MKVQIILFKFACEKPTKMGVVIGDAAEDILCTNRTMMSGAGGRTWV